MRHFPSCFKPHRDSEVSCIVFMMKISFHSSANKINFHMKSFALSLTFVMLFKASRKWPINLKPIHLLLTILCCCCCRCCCLLDSAGTCVLKENSTVHVTGEGRSFSSPRYPANPGIGTCSWNITVPPGEVVKLTFWNFEGPCDQNYAEVFDVTNATSKFLGKFCTSRYFNQQMMYSDGNNVMVRHSSLSTSDQNGGFTATYEVVKARPARYSCSNFLLIRLNDTRGGEFASFDYPLPYPNNVKCSWVIEAPLGYVVQLTFHSLALEQSKDCQSDYVEVKQGFAEAAPSPIGRFCGFELPSVITSKYYKVYVDFVTDSFHRYPGFHASYTFVSDRK